MQLCLMFECMADAHTENTYRSSVRSAKGRAIDHCTDQLRRGVHFFFSMHLKCNKNLCLRSRALIVANMCNLWISLPTKHSPSPNCIDDDAGLFASQFKISKAEKRRKQRCEPIDKMSARSTWQRDANGNHRDAMLAESALVLELFSLFIFSAFLVDAVCQTKSPKCG